MADDIRYGILTVARKDNEAKALMKESIAALMKDVRATIGVDIKDGYNGNTINSQLSEILKNCQKQSKTLLLDVKFKDNSVKAIEDQINKVASSKSLQPKITIGLDKEGTKSLIAKQLNDVINQLATEQTVKIKLSGKQGTASGSANAVSQAVPNAAATNDALAVNQTLYTSYSNLARIEEVAAANALKYGASSSTIKSQVKDANGTLQSFTQVITNAKGQTEQLYYKINETGSGYDLLKSRIMDVETVQEKLARTQSKLNTQFNAWVDANPKLASQHSAQVANVRQLINAANQSEQAAAHAAAAFSSLRSQADISRESMVGSFKTIAAEFGKMFRRLGSTMLATQLYASIYKIFDAVKQIDSAMISLKKVTDETESSYNRFLTTAAQNAKELGILMSDLIEQTATWSKLGYNLSQASELAKVSAVYSNVGEVDNETAVKDIVTAMKAYDLDTSQAINIVDALNKLGNEFATDAASLGEGLKNSASAMAFAGNDLSQTLALLTGGGEITQNVGNLGNALKVVSLRLQNQLGKLQEIGEDYEGIESVSKTQTQIYNLTHGKVNIMQDNDPTSFKSTYEILEQIAAVIKELNQTEASELMQLMFGKSRANQGMAILQAFQSGQVQKALDAANNSAGSAYKEHEKWLDSFQAKLLQLKASAQSFSNDLLNSDLLKGTTDFLTTVVTLLDNIIKDQGAVTVIAGVATGIITLRKNAGELLNTPVYAQPQFICA